MIKNKQVGWNTHCISHVVWKRWELLIASPPAFCSLQRDVAMSCKKEKKKKKSFYLLLSYIEFTLSSKYPSISRSASWFYPLSLSSCPPEQGRWLRARAPRSGGRGERPRRRSPSGSRRDGAAALRRAPREAFVAGPFGFSSLWRLPYFFIAQ